MCLNQLQNFWVSKKGICKGICDGILLGGEVSKGDDNFFDRKCENSQRVCTMSIKDFKIGKFTLKTQFCTTSCSPTHLAFVGKKSNVDLFHGLDAACRHRLANVIKHLIRTNFIELLVLA